MPDAVVFRTKLELALETLQQAMQRGLPFRWVTADSVYGDSPTFVQGVRALGRWYTGEEVVARLPAQAWKRVVVAESSQGLRIYAYAEQWVWFAEEGLPSGRERLLVRRSLGQQVEWKYHRSNAPREVRLEKLAQVRRSHGAVEDVGREGAYMEGPREH